MLGFAPLSSAPIGDDAAALPLIRATTVLTLALFGKSSAALGLHGGTHLILDVTPQLRAEALERGISESSLSLSGAAWAAVSSAGSGSDALGMSTTLTARAQSASGCEAEVTSKLESDAGVHIRSGLSGLIGLSGKVAGQVLQRLQGEGRKFLSGTSTAHNLQIARSRTLWPFLRAVDVEVFQRGAAARDVSMRLEAQGTLKTIAASVNLLALAAQSIGSSDVSSSANQSFETEVDLQAALLSLGNASGHYRVGGEARGKLLKARFGAFLVPLSFQGEAQGNLKTSLGLIRPYPVTGNSIVRAQSSSESSGVLSVTNGASLEVLAQGQFADALPLFGFALSANRTGASTPTVALPVEGKARSQSQTSSRALGQLALYGSHKGVLSAKGFTQGSAGLTGRARLSLTSKGQFSDGFTIDLALRCQTTPRAFAHAQVHFGACANGKARVAPRADHASSLIGTSSGRAAVTLLAKATLRLARTFDAEARIVAGTARHIALSGAAEARCAGKMDVRSGTLALHGASASRSRSAARLAGRIPFFTEGRGRAAAQATLQALQSLGLVGAGQTSIRSEGHVSLAHIGVAQAQSVTQGHLAGRFQSGSLGFTRTTILAGAATAFEIKRRAKVQVQSLVGSIGHLSLTPLGDGKAKIEVDLGRVFLTFGQGVARVNLAARAPRADLELSGGAQMIVGARLESRALLSARGQSNGETRTQGTSEATCVCVLKAKAAIALEVLSSNELQVLGSANSRLHTQTRSRPELTILQRSFAKTASVAQSEGLAWIPGGAAALVALNKARLSDLSISFPVAVLGYRAPPALGREAYARSGLSGRIHPSNDVHVIYL